MAGKIKYKIKAELWQHPGPGGWHFISLPQKMSKEIRKLLGSEEEGWGRLKAKAKIGDSEWETAIWFDTKREAYLLPVKAGIRKKEKLETEKKTEVTLWL